MRRTATFRSYFSKLLVLITFCNFCFPGSPLRNLPFLFYPHPRGRFRIGLPGFHPFSPSAENSGRKIWDITRGFKEISDTSYSSRNSSGAALSRCSAMSMASSAYRIPIIFARSRYASTAVLRHRPARINWSIDPPLNRK